MNKTTKILLILLLLALGWRLAAWYFYKKENANPESGLKPRIEMGVARISAITDSTLDLSLDLLVHNPLPVGLDIESMAYTVRMGETTIVENEYAKPFVVEGRDSSTVNVAAQLNLLNLIEEINKQDRLGNDSVDYHMEGILNLRKPFLGKDTLRISRDMRMEVYHLPEVEVLGFDLEKFRLNKSDITLKLKLTNKNSFPLEFKNPTYSINVGKQDQLLKGSTSGGTTVQAKSTDTYEIPFKLDMGDLVKTAGQLLFQGKDLPFKLNFKCTLASPNEMVNNSTLNYIVDGELRDLEELKNMMNKK